MPTFSPESTKKILVTTGEPAGIGPDLIVQIAQQQWSNEITVIGDPNLLITRARNLGLPLQLIPVLKDEPASSLVPGQLKIIPCYLNEACTPGKLSLANAAYVMEMLTTAGNLAKNNTVDALVTAPVHKAILNQAGFPFTGHTDFFAQLAGVNDNSVMLFVAQYQHMLLKVALTTVHLPLAQVTQHLTSTKLTNTVHILYSSLKNNFKITHPRIAVCGLNPHAGENGYLGTEETEIIIPTLHCLRKLGYNLIGPLSADIVFTAKVLTQVDAVLTMYHDQGLPVVKALNFGGAVNVTLGLPFLRTSVDHGTALDIAGTNQADANSLCQAIKLAEMMLMQ